ncbi:hypothetical protein LNK15_00370 [Jeotgalicoccus huakuii]|uniref:hypothetical protein n=1 Tax=Jeotgalicoccus sp. S0W5 TaxID=2527874 RepID=UPI001414FA09|nr:hypothetical protein [Jeotgalicoccus sp. S0W5]MCK1975507.1 hypothetical protein [Jeotgalicoccus huakuii]
MASIPGFYTAGVDLMLSSFEDVSPKVIEINSYPMLGIAVFPTYGPTTTPSKDYFRAVVARDQFMNDTSNSYEIENSDTYLKTYFKFDRRRTALYEKFYVELSEIYVNQ